MYTRKQYMDGVCTHEQYYAQFVNNDTKTLVIENIGLKAIQESKDEHMNDIPLKKWDRLTGYLDTSLFTKYGDCFSIAGGVCILKASARELKKIYSAKACFSCGAPLDEHGRCTAGLSKAD